MARATALQARIELAVQRLLFGRQLGWSLHLNLHVQIAEFTGLHALDALAAQAEAEPRLRARRNLHVDVAVERADFDLVAERGLRLADRRARDEVVTFALESRLAEAAALADTRPADAFGPDSARSVVRAVAVAVSAMVDIRP